MSSIRKTPSRKFFRSLAGGLILLSLWGCFEERVAGTTGVGNPPQSEITFAMVATKATPAASKISATPSAGPFAESARLPDGESDGESDSAFPVVDRGGVPFVLRSALANVGLVKFKLPDGLKCTPDIVQACEVDDIKVHGPFVADLMTGTLSPAFPSFKAPVGDYRRVEIRLEALESGAATPEPALIGHSMILSGTFAYQGKPDRAFNIVLDFDEEARFDSGSANVKEKIVNTLLLLFDVDAWLAQADIGRCLDDGSLVLDTLGNLRIDKDNTCSGLEKAIKDGVKASGRLDEAP